MSDDSAVNAPNRATPGSDGFPSTRVPARTIAFVLAAAALGFACVLFAVKYFAADDIPALTESTLDAAEKQWDEAGLASYDLELELRGAQPGVVHVEVRDGEVKVATRDSKETPKWTRDTWTVSGMFDTLEQDMQIASNPEKEIQAEPGTTWRLRCEFDSKYGVPWRYHRMATGGPEVNWRVTRFESK